MIFFLFLIYKDIPQSCYTNGEKELNKVQDPWPDLLISAQCEIIQNRCFYELKTLNSFSFHDNPNLTTIGSYSFYNCENLTIVNLSSCNKLKKISDSAFRNCNKVSEILLPRGLLEIQYEAFESNCLVTNVTIPGSVEILGSSAFRSCGKLENVIFEDGSNLTSLESGVFTYTHITSFQIP